MRFTWQSNEPAFLAQGGWANGDAGRRLAMLEEEGRGRHEAMAASFLALRCVAVHLVACEFCNTSFARVGAASGGLRWLVSLDACVTMIGKLRLCAADDPAVNLDPKLFTCFSHPIRVGTFDIPLHAQVHQHPVVVLE